MSGLVTIYAFPYNSQITYCVWLENINAKFFCENIVM